MGRRRRGDGHEGEGGREVIRLSGTIVWEGGRRQEIEITQRDFVAWEQYAVRTGLDPSPANAPPMMWARYLGYAAAQRLAGRARAEWPLFEDWEAEDVELEGEDGAPAIAPANPTLVDRSAG